MLSDIVRIYILATLIYAAPCTAIPSVSKLFGKRSLPDPSSVTVSSCGISKNVIWDADRIVGGREAAEGEFPWQVSLRFKTSYISPVHLCGAAILNEEWILTAAHCVYGRMPENLEVAVGVYKQDEDGKFASSYGVEKIIAHENFDPVFFRNDISLLKLRTPISFTRSNGLVNGICLPQQNAAVTGFATAAGWGSTYEDGGMSNVLLAVELPIVPHVVCRALFGGGGLIADNMLCAGRSSGGIDTCQGDSGGPLIQRDARGIATVVGIVSWGVGCARRGYPGVYASVPAFVDWIVKHVK